MRKPYYLGFGSRFYGIGIMFETNPPFAALPIAWSFEIRLGWLLFWYVKRQKCQIELPTDQRSVATKAKSRFERS